MNLSDLTNPLTSTTDNLGAAQNSISIASIVNPGSNDILDNGSSNNLNTATLHDQKQQQQQQQEESRTTEEEGKRTRLTGEYRLLYNYLMDKFKTATDISNILSDFELYLRNLAKYQQLRNNMLVDMLLFINKNEELNPVKYDKHDELTKRLEDYNQVDQKLKKFTNILIELEKREDDKDFSKNLHMFEELVGLDSSLSSDLSIQETNLYPDLYHGDFDTYEIVKKNRCYENKLTSMVDLKKTVASLTRDSQSDNDLIVLPKKRKSPLVASDRTKRTKNDGSLMPVEIMPRLELYEASQKPKK